MKKYNRDKTLLLIEQHNAQAERCPICAMKYFAIDASEYVCYRHQNWLVTQCLKCKRYCFSYVANFCPHHCSIHVKDNKTLSGNILYKNLKDGI